MSADAAPAPATKPVKPDEAAFKKELERLEKEHKQALEQFQAVKAKLENALPGKNGEASPAQKRRQELIAELNEIRTKQGAGKQDRNSKANQLKQLDEQLRRRISEQKAARAKVPYKSAEEIDAKIKSLEQEVESGKLKLVDEKKALAEVTSLRKLRKTFTGLDGEQAAIDELKAKIKEVKESMDNPEAKALSARYDELQAELNALKEEQDSARKNLTELRKERDDLYKKQQSTWAALKKHKDDYHTQRKAAQQWEREQREKRRERERLERERIAKERRLARAKELLAEASEPAYAEELRRAHNLARFLDPSYVSEEKGPLLADKGLAAAPQRKVDASGFEGMRLVRKEDRDDDYLPAKKTGKKGKKGAAAPPEAKFNVPPSVIGDCAFLGVNPPMSAADIPQVLEKVKAKIAQWKADQPEQTRKNIEKAKKEIERLEAEEAAEASGNGTANKPEAPETDKAVAEVTEKVAEAALDDKAAEETKEVEASA
ncbi:hypothetical protein VTJ83DRAFT_4750 [Remersonia thermophila]|uniref:Nuclear segregation protein n=1 Tax=Remersonia thermophila TaxID=72144 RepID=A0ABR4DAT9_9PEZI